MGSHAEIRLGDLRAGYGDREVLHSISCTLRGNRTTVIVGPGGSGKTTLLEAIIRTGREGFWLSGTIDGAPEQVGFLAQKAEAPDESLATLLGRWPHSASDPEGWVRDFWRRGAEPAGEALVALLDTPVAALSRVLQRLAQLTVVASNPASVLLIDEPDRGAGERARAWMTSKLAAMRGQRTVILVTHHLGLARQASDDAIFLLDGDIIEAGATSSMFSRPQHPRTRDLLTYGS